MPRKTTAAHPDIEQLEHHVADVLAIAPHDIVGECGRLLGMSKSNYYHLRRRASSPTDQTRNYIFALCSVLSAPQLRRLHQQVKAWQQPTGEGSTHEQA